MSGELPIKNERMERFAQLVAIGESRAESYRTVAKGEITPDTAKSNGLRWYRRPNISARIQYLRNRNLSGEASDTDLDQTTLLDLMHTATTSFEQAIAALEAISASPRVIASLRADLVTHINRLNRLQPARAVVKLSEQNHVAVALDAMHRCVCRTPRKQARTAL